MRLTTQRQVDAAPKGMHGLGDNLWLDVRSETSKAWLFIRKVNGKNQSMGLGSAVGSKGAKVSLVDARAKAGRTRELLRLGKDPRAEKARDELTLRSAVKAYVDRHNSQWRSEADGDQVAAFDRGPCRGDCRSSDGFARGRRSQTGDRSLLAPRLRP